LPEWLIERGVGETRYALVEAGEIVEARIELDGTQRAGSVIAVRLVSAASRNALARDERGTEYLLPRGAPGVTEGAKLNIEITREAIPGAEPWKRPLAQVTDGPIRSAPEPQARLAVRGELDSAGWEDVIEQARTGIAVFAGGELRIEPTSAMTLIDVDGYLPPNELAIAGAGQAAKAIRRLDIGGSIGIDLPTAGSKAPRQQAAEAIDAFLPQPFERTAVNGFGFVQIVRPRQRASLIELAQDRASFEARALLRRAAFEPAGAKRLVAHPAVVAVLESHPEWLEALARQVGGSIGLRPDPALPMSGGYAEKA
jgi:hypothetical protein